MGRAAHHDVATASRGTVAFWPEIGSKDAGTYSWFAAHVLGLRDVEWICSRASQPDCIGHGEGLLKAYPATSQFECRSVPEARCTFERAIQDDGSFLRVPWASSERI